MKLIETAMKKLRYETPEDVLYLCNRTKCKNCSYPLCMHTRDIRFAKSYKLERDKNKIWYVEEVKEND